MEKDDEKLKVKNLRHDLEKKEEYIDKLTKKIDDFEEIRIKGEENAEKLSILYSQGVFDANGDLFK